MSELVDSMLLVKGRCCLGTEICDKPHLLLHQLLNLRSQEKGFRQCHRHCLKEKPACERSSNALRLPLYARRPGI